MNSNELTLLMDAAISIDSTAAELAALIRQGEAVNAVTSYGYTALHWAAQADECEEEKDRYERIKVLVAAGANIEARDVHRGHTPLMRAVEEGGVGQLRGLIESGADLNTRANDGTTPLILATTYCWRRTEKVPLLLAAGADLTLRDSRGWSAFDHARFQYLMWKGIATDHARNDVTAEELVGRIPPDIQGRIRGTTMLMIREELGRSLQRRESIELDSTEKSRDEAAIVLQMIEKAIARSA